MARADVSYADPAPQGNSSPTKVGHVANIIESWQNAGSVSSKASASSVPVPSAGGFGGFGSGNSGSGSVRPKTAWRGEASWPEAFNEMLGRLDGLENRVEELSRALERLAQRFDGLQPGDIARRLEEQEARILATRCHLEATEHQLSRDVASHGNLIRSVQTQFAELQRQLCKAASMSATQELSNRVEDLEAKHKHSVGQAAQEAVRKEYERLVLELAQVGPSARARRPDTPSDWSLLSDVDRLEGLSCKTGPFQGKTPHSTPRGPVLPAHLYRESEES